MLSKRIKRLNNAQILALPSARIALTPVYADRVALPVHFSAVFVWFADISGSGVSHLNWGAGTNLQWNAIKAGLFANGESMAFATNINAGNFLGNNGDTLNSVVGLPITLEMTPGADFTGGDARNELILQLAYLWIPAT